MSDKDTGYIYRYDQSKDGDVSTLMVSSADKKGVITVHHVFSNEDAYLVHQLQSEITRLRAENERLREACKITRDTIASHSPMVLFAPDGSTLFDMLGQESGDHISWDEWEERNK